MRAVIGARYDYYDFDVSTRVERNINNIVLTPNNGTAGDGKFSLKGSLSYLLTEQWEVYGSVGQGIHSNDARGTTIEVDPADGSTADTVDPLVESLGAEIGVRGFSEGRFNTSLALWTLELESELLFVGDAGNTEASRESRRSGVELTAYFHLADTWTLDFEYAYTDAEFTSPDPGDPALGDYIPGALSDVAGIGLSRSVRQGWYGSARLRYLGERPLEEDNRVRSGDSAVVNLRGGYRWAKAWLTVDVLNLFDADDHDIDYFYTSRLPGEPAAGVDDIHYHVMEPRTVRVYAGVRF